MADNQSALDQYYVPKARPSTGIRRVQDPEAAKDAPVALARGFVSGVLGAPGDIESIARLLLNIQGPERFVMPRSKEEGMAMLGQIFGANRVGLESALPTSEDIEKRLPFKSDTPVSNAFTGMGQLAGGFYTGPGAPIRLVAGIPEAMVKAGRDFAMSAGQPATRMAPEVVIPGALTRVQEAVRQSKGDYGAKRVQRAADEVKDLEKLYKEEALRQAFTGDNAQAMMTMNPADFEKFALEMKTIQGKPLRPLMFNAPGEIDKYSMPTDEYIQYLQRLRGGFEDVPFLGINKDEYGLPIMPFISGHEGRHRSRALAASGQPTSIVRLVPRAELREPFPRRNQEEYIEALRRELELTDNMIVPEGDLSAYRSGEGPPPRPAIRLPEPYAKGGPIKGPLSCGCEE